MQQRWNRYSQENYYAMGIEFHEIITEIMRLLEK